MTQDCFGGRHTDPRQGALLYFEEAVRSIAEHRPASGDALRNALAADPHLEAAYALRGLAAVILAREEMMPQARQMHVCALEARSVKGDATPTERALTDALDAAANGRLLGAAGRLDRHLLEHPHDFLAAKLSHALRFMAGDSEGMLRGTSWVLSQWDGKRPGFGFLLGCHAFALEEQGDLVAAERVGQRALEFEPLDVWSLHAVSHVHEMQGRVDEGVAWIEAKRPVWTQCNNFSFHMAWHLALFHLECGDHDRVLAIYDGEVRPQPTDDFRDMANAVSLLWRLEQDGVDVGRRWHEIRDIAERRRRDVTLTFACLHNLIALVASGDEAAARELAHEMLEHARRNGRNCDQAAVMADVGCDLAQAILGLGQEGGRAAQPLATLASRLQRIGGSHVQRDVFVRTLAQVAASRGDDMAFEQVMAVRCRLKRDDRFAQNLRARLYARKQPIRLSA